MAPAGLHSSLGAAPPPGLEAGSSSQSSHSPVAQHVQTKWHFVSCVGGGQGPSSDRFVQQRGDVLLLVAVCGTEHHYAVL